MELLHLEDSQMDAELIGILLKREWPECKINHVTNAPEYHRAIARGGYDLILSD